MRTYRIDIPTEIRKEFDLTKYYFVIPVFGNRLRVVDESQLAEELTNPIFYKGVELKSALACSVRGLRKGKMILPRDLIESFNLDKGISFSKTKQGLYVSAC